MCEVLESFSKVNFGKNCKIYIFPRANKVPVPYSCLIAFTAFTIVYDDLPSMDKWMLGRLSAVLKEVDEATEEYQFNRAIQELLRFGG